jgi:hypothetical protein
VLKVNYMEYAPSCCKKCLTANHPPYLDMECVDDFHGHVYYCMSCVREMSNLLGFMSPEQVDLLKENHQEEIEELEEAVRFGTVLDWLASNSIDLRDFIAWVESTKVHVGAARDRRKEQKAESRPVESSDEQRLDSVSTAF